MKKEHILFCGLRGMFNNSINPSCPLPPPLPPPAPAPAPPLSPPPPPPPAPAPPPPHLLEQQEVSLINQLITGPRNQATN